MYMAPKIAILGQPRRGLKARAQHLVQMPVSATFEVPTGKPCLSHSALTDHLVNQEAASRTLQLFRSREIATRQTAMQ